MSRKGKGGWRPPPGSVRPPEKAPAGFGNRPFAVSLKDAKPARPKAQPAAPAPKPARRLPDPRGVVRGRPPATTPRPEQPEAPLASYSYEDRVAFQQAFGGVRPLAAKRTARRPVSLDARPARDPAASAAADQSARVQLQHLVAEAAHFDLERGEDGVSLLRRGAHRSHLRALRDGATHALPRLDLHGMTAREAADAVVSFIRTERRRGTRTVLIIHGKGLHSEDGRGVLADEVLDALRRRVGHQVLAATTAPARCGGQGAIVVRLGDH